MHRRWFWKISAAVLVLAHLALVSCKDDPASSPPQQPALPPAASMTTDLSLFVPPSGPSKAFNPNLAGANFLNAAARVTFINAGVIVGLSAPVAVFAAAASQTPTQGADGKYHWQYTSTVKAITYTADLAGSVDGRTQESVWEMRITATALGLNNFLWYDGRAKLNNSSGYWDFYDPAQPATSVKAVHLTWTYASNTDATLSFEIVKDGVPEKGDKLEYVVAGNLTTITFTDASPVQQVVISWDRITRAGYLIAPDYNNGAKSCWDTNLDDVACM